MPSNILDRYETSLEKEKVPVKSSSEAMGATTDEKTGTILDRPKIQIGVELTFQSEEPMETESSSATPMETKTDPPTGDASAEPTQE